MVMTEPAALAFAMLIVPLIPLSESTAPPPLVAETVTVSFPAVCVGEPRWIQAEVGAVRFQVTPLGDGSVNLAGWAEYAMNMSDDIKAVLGMFNASLGQQGNEISGKAIRER